MPSEYLTPGGGASGSSAYLTPGSRPTRVTTEKKRPGFFDFGGELEFLNNLGTDIFETIVGFPGGVKALATDPVDTSKNIGKAYAFTYGPLFRGDIETFKERVVEHPLGPILDALVVGTLGTGAAVRVGALPAASKPLTLTTRTGERIEQRLVRNPTTNILRRGARSVTTTPPTRSLPVVGEFARAERFVNKKQRRKEQAQTFRALEPFQRATRRKFLFRGLNKNERKVLTLFTAGTSPSSRIAFHRTRLKEVEDLLKQETGKEIPDANVLREILGEIDDQTRAIKFYDGIPDSIVGNPSDQLLLAAEESRRLYTRTGDILEDAGLLTAETRAIRPYLDLRIERGARVLSTSKKQASRKPKFEFAGGPSIAALKAEFPNIIGVPHLEGKFTRRGTAIPQKRSGAVPPRIPGIARMNKGIRLLSARYLPLPEVYVDAYVRAIGYLHAKARGELAIRFADELNPDNSLNGTNWRYVNLDGERIPRSARERPGLGEQMDEFLNGDQDLTSFVDRNLATKSSNVADSWINAGLRVGQIPDSTFNRIFGDLRPANSIVRKLIDRPTDLWRALTLNYRPAWLVNNIVGQHLLYSISNAGQGGARGYARAVLKARSGYFPAELRFGLFATEQAFRTPVLREASTIVGKVTQGIGRFNAILSDELPRRAGFFAKAERERRIFNRINGTNKTFDEFLGDLQRAAENPNLAKTSKMRKLHDQLVQEVLDELVDFNNLTHVERTVVRRFVPFYSWIKGVTKATGLLSVEHPAKAALMYWLSRQGILDLQSEIGHVPSYIYEFIPFGEDGEELLGVTAVGINPLSTVGDVMEQAFEQNPALAFGPLPRGAIEAIGGVDIFTQQRTELRGGIPGLAERFGRGFVRDFPQVQTAEKVLAPLEPQTKTGKRRLTVPGARVKILGVSMPVELLRYAGIPVKKINAIRARELGEEEQDIPPATTIAPRSGSAYLDAG